MGLSLLCIMEQKPTMLSEHFSLEEMVRSGVAIRRKIENNPSLADIDRLRQLCVNVLEPVRRRFGVTRISSGYRSVPLNAAVGGVVTSQHLTGEAADIHISDAEKGRKVYEYIRCNLDFDQLLFEHRMSNGCRWLHVSYTTRRPNRRQARPMEC